MSKRILSGMQPSGEVHLGNYLGAIRNWVELQADNQVIIMIADLHAITVPQEPDQLRARSLELAKIFIACGIDPTTTILFKQSDVPAHAELAWILNSITYMGELSRMIQYKDKSQKVGADVSSVGLFDYPVLQAADILLYDTDAVPVGEDQRQHLELTRDLAERFNKRFGQTFKLPDTQIYKTTARIMSLADPKRKMSKSDGPNTYIGLLDEPDEIRAKLKRAVTTPEGLDNLMDLHVALSGEDKNKLKTQFEGQNQGFKEALSELVIAKLVPIAQKYAELDDVKVKDILQQGSEQANNLAQSKLTEVKRRVGLS